MEANQHVAPCINLYTVKKGKFFFMMFPENQLQKNKILMSNVNKALKYNFIQK